MARKFKNIKNDHKQKKTKKKYTKEFIKSKNFMTIFSFLKIKKKQKKLNAI